MRPRARSRLSRTRTAWRSPMAPLAGCRSVRPSPKEETVMTSTQAPAGSTAAVRGFAELSRADVELAGGKGANLGELTSAGLPVPPGFVVGAPAYASFVDESGLRQRIAASLENVDIDDVAA